MLFQTTVQRWMQFEFTQTKVGFCTKTTPYVIVCRPDDLGFMQRLMRPCVSGCLVGEIRRGPGTTEPINGVKWLPFFTRP